MNGLKAALKSVWQIMQRQVAQMWHNHIYIFCMLIFPLFTTFFFTDMMKQGLPTELPVGIVDLDMSSTSRKMARSLDGMQLVKVTAHYPNVTEARRAVQRGEIYGFFYFPNHMAADLMASRQPTVSFYYNGAVLLAGSMAYKSMRTEATLGSAAVAMAKMSALGLRPEQIKQKLQPIVVESHLVNNPTLDYNVYLSTSLIPACFGIFFFLITAYSLGTELKFEKAKDWIKQAKGDIVIAMTGKMLPITFVFAFVMFVYVIWLYYVNGFPHACSTWLLLFNSLLFIFACQGVGIFIFGLIPSLRLSMSVCALLAVLSFSIAGFTFPVSAMHPSLQTLSWIFPMRSYYMIYQMVVLNGYPTASAWVYYVVLLVFALLPILVLPRIKNIMLTHEYIS